MQRAKLHVLLAALLLVTVDAAKPLVVDDPAYVLFARQILAHPTDPYGFEILWYDVLTPAFEVTAPPVLPYWLAASMAVFGDEPVAWKLALFPFALVFAAALHRLLARFTPGLEIPLLWMTVVSPSVLPFVNLMLDLPARALGLLATALFLSACDRGSARTAAAAGLAAGLAMQTKYTGVIAFCTLLVWGVLSRRLRLAILALAVGAGVFWGWEGLLALRYGQSHFLAGASTVLEIDHGSVREEAALWASGFLILLGAVLPAVGVLGLAAFGLRRSAIALAAVALAVFAAIPFVAAEPPPLVVFEPRLDRLDDVAFGMIGGATAAIGAAVAWAALRGGTREDRFLVLWLALEVAGFALLSPFLAARRVLGVALVAPILCGRVLLAGRHGRALLRVPVGVGIALGVLFTAAELVDARLTRDAVRLSSARLAELGAAPDQHTVWYVGHWAFKYYAEAAGMQPVVPERSLLRRDDWLVIPDGVAQQPIAVPNVSPALARVELHGWFPWSTSPWAYAGPVPVRARSASRIRVTIHRALWGTIARWPRIGPERVGLPLVPPPDLDPLRQ